MESRLSLLAKAVAKHLNQKHPRRCFAVQIVAVNITYVRKRMKDGVRLSVRFAEILLAQRERTQNIAVTLAERRQTLKTKKNVVKRKNKQHN